MIVQNRYSKSDNSTIHFMHALGSHRAKFNVQVFLDFLHF